MHKQKSQKQLQVAENIKREIANIFLREDLFKTNDFKLTILEADASPDLKNVKIYVNIFGFVDKSKVIEELNDNSYYFKKRLSSIIKLKATPRIVFILDESSDNAIRISNLIDSESTKF